MALVSLDQRFATPARSVLDYPALVTLLGAYQRHLPTAQIALRCAADDGRTSAIDSLIALFGGPGRFGANAKAAALAGQFNPSVPNSDTPSTLSKAF